MGNLVFWLKVRERKPWEIAWNKARNRVRGKWNCQFRKFYFTYIKFNFHSIIFQRFKLFSIQICLYSNFVGTGIWGKKYQYFVQRPMFSTSFTCPWLNDMVEFRDFPAVTLLIYLATSSYHQTCRREMASPEWWACRKAWASYIKIFDSKIDAMVLQHYKL